MPWPTSNTNTKNYDPFGGNLRSGDKRTSNTAPVDSESVAEIRRKMMDSRMAKAAYDKIPQVVKDAESEMGLDPETIIQFLGSDKDWKSDLKAGALDALYGAAATGAGMLSAIPSPRKEKFSSQRDLLRNRQQIIRGYLARVNEEERSPGTVISKASEMAGEILNPAGKAKYLNAAYHGLRGFAKEGSAVDAGVSAGSNLAGEATEDALTRLIPGLSKISGLPGNIIGSGVFEPVLSKLTDDDKNAAEAERVRRIKELRIKMMREGKRSRTS